MNKIVTASLLLTTLTATLLSASDGHKKLGLLASLPHPMKAVMKNMDALEISEAQNSALAELLESVPPKMHQMMEEAEKLEEKLKRAVMHERKTKEQIKVQLNTLEELKRSITFLQIDAINTLQSILTPKQLQKLYAMLSKQK